MIIASDLDGAFTDHPELRQKTDFIITGRHWSDYSATDETAYNLEGIPIFFNTVEPNGDVLKIVTHKSNVINKTRSNIFYEDQQEQVTMLRILCPNCKIILVEEGKTYI